MNIPISPTIDVKNLCKSFNGKPAVENLSLQVFPGEIFGFMGPNGGGKTTTIRMLCGLLTPDCGTGKCLGYNIITQAIDIKTHIGYMTQTFSLYTELTVRENLEFAAKLYGLKNRDQIISEKLTTFELEPYAKQLVGTLSGGWKQRLSLCAALLHDPQLLFLDEPTSGVDPKSRKEFWEQIHLLSAKGVTTLVSTHYTDEAHHCNRLAYVFKGRITSYGTKQDIIKQSGLITWEITNKQIHSNTPKVMRQLLIDLKQHRGIELATTFDDTIHISGHDPVLLQQTINELPDSLYNWQQITPTLEDVFINLSKE